MPCEAPEGAEEELEEEKAAADAVGGSRRRSMWRRSSARGLPAAAARSRAVVEGSKLGGRDEYTVCRQAHIEIRMGKKERNAHSFLQEPFHIVHGNQRCG